MRHSVLLITSFCQSDENALVVVASADSDIHAREFCRYLIVALRIYPSLWAFHVVG